MPMLIADSNALRNHGLKAYLANSRENCMALPETTLVEMRKKNALSTSRESLLIASQFLNQVFVVKQTHQILDYSMASEPEVEKLFDYPATVELHNVCQGLMTLPPPDLLKRYMAEQEEIARDYIAQLSVQAEQLEGSLVDATKEFKPDQIKELRTGCDVSEATKETIFALWKETTAGFVLDNQTQQIGKRLTLKEARGTFAFRYSLCMMIYYIMWVRTGRQTGKKVHLRVNDSWICNFAALSTYFNGMLTADKLPFDTSRAARAILKGYDAYLGEDWEPATT